MSRGNLLMERARGASIGATIVGFFGAAWLMLGMMSAGVSWQMRLAAVLPVLALIAVSRRAGAAAAAEDCRGGDAGEETDDARVRRGECRAVGRDFRGGQSAAQTCTSRRGSSRRLC